MKNPFRWCIALDCSSKTVEMRAGASFEKISSFDENHMTNWEDEHGSARRSATTWQFVVVM